MNTLCSIAVTVMLTATAALAGAWVGARSAETTTAEAVAAAHATTEARVRDAENRARAAAVREWRAQADAQAAEELARQAQATDAALASLARALDRRVALNTRTLQEIADAASRDPTCPERPMLAALAATVGAADGVPDARDRPTPAAPGDP